MGYIYYSTRRPVTPGSFPRPVGNNVIQAVNYDSINHIDGIGDFYGYIEYKAKLSNEEWEEYELIPGDYRYWYGVRCRENSNGAMALRMLKPVLAKDMPEGKLKITERYTIIERWFEQERDAEQFCRTQKFLKNE